MLAFIWLGLLWGTCFVTCLMFFYVMELGKHVHVLVPFISLVMVRRDNRG